MNTKIRFLLALALLGVIVVAATGTPAWAERLFVGGEAPAAGEPLAALPAGSRQQGTVTTTDNFIPVTGGERTNVGSCAWVWVIDPPVQVEYTAQVVPVVEIPQQDPGVVETCAIRLDAVVSSDLGAKTQVCWSILPNPKEIFGYYWDGSTWLNTPVDIGATETCVFVPIEAGNPAFTALFSED
jgi:hypothetical protein